MVSVRTSIFRETSAPTSHRRSRDYTLVREEPVNNANYRTRIMLKSAAKTAARTSSQQWNSPRTTESHLNMDSGFGPVRAVAASGE